MITINSKELPYIIDLPASGSIAFAGDITHCCNIAARIHKHSNTILGINLSSTSDLPTNANASVKLYYAGDDAYALNIQDDTFHVIFVSDSHRASEKLASAIVELRPDVTVQHEHGHSAIGKTKAMLQLDNSNLDVIAALEEMFLSDTPLAAQRRLYRYQVEAEINETLNPVAYTEEEMNQIRDYYIKHGL